MRRLVRRSFAIAVVAFMVLIAFQSSIPDAMAQEEEDVRLLKIGSIEGIDSASPFVGIYDIAWVYYGLVYDCLTTIGKDLEVEPHLAHSWWYMDGETASAGVDIVTDFTNATAFGDLGDPSLWPLGSIWEYNITENVFWNDGIPFSAEDVVWTINIQIGINFMVYWAYQPYTRWIHHAEKVDDYKVRIFFMDFQTNEPMPIAWGESLFFTIMPKHYFEDFPSTYMAYNWDGYPAIGTGPFVPTENLIQDIIDGESVTLLKNEYYDFEDNDGMRKGLGAYYDQTINIDRVLLKFFTEESALSLSVRTGDVHVAKIQPNTYNEWMQDPAFPEEVRLVNNLACTSYSKQVCLNAYEEGPGTLNPLRLDPAVQRAAALAVNKTLIIETVYKGLAEEGVALISPVTKWWWEPPEDEMCTWYLNDSLGFNLFNYTKPMSEVMDYDPALANEILDAAGYEWSGTEGDSVRQATALADARLHEILDTPIGEVEGMTLDFEMIIDSTVFEERLIGDRVKATWEGVGIYIENELTSAAQWTNLIYTYTYNTMITYWSGDPDPAYLSFAPTSYALFGWNEFGTNSPEYDALYIEQAKSLDFDDRKAKMDEVNKWLYLSGSVCTPVYPRICFAYNEKIWTNWGNWTQYPGLTIDHFWGGSTLWYSLEYTGEEEQETSYMWLIVTGIAVIAIAAVAVTVSKIRKRKIDKEIMMEEEAEKSAEEPREKG